MYDIDKHMNSDYDRIEEDLKQKSERKKEHKISGRSVFEIQRIIREKAEDKKEEGGGDCCSGNN